MGWFSEKKPETVYRCISCEQETSGDAEKLEKKGLMIKSGLYLCPTCYESKGFNVSSFKNLTELELLTFYYERGLISPYKFTPTKRVHRLGSDYESFVYMEIDTKRKKINMPFIDSGMLRTTITDRVYDYQDIIDFTVVENGVPVADSASVLQEVTDHGVGIRALHKSKSSADSMKCSDLSINVIVNDHNSPDVSIKFIGPNSGGFKKSQKKGSTDYKRLVTILERCVYLLTLILRESKGMIDGVSAREQILANPTSLVATTSSGVSGKKSKEATQVYRCISCEQETSGDAKKLEKEGLMSISGLYLCPTCYGSKGYNFCAFKNLTEVELLAFYQEHGLISPYEFTPTKRVHRLDPVFDSMVYIEIDTKRKKINMPFVDSGMLLSTITDRVYNYQDIIDFTVVENGTPVTDSASVLQEVTDNGVVISALHGGSADVNKCSDLSIKVIVNDPSSPDVSIKFIGPNSGGFKKSQGKDSADYKRLVKILEQCVYLLTLILRENKGMIDEASAREQLLASPTSLVATTSSGLFGKKTKEATQVYRCISCNKGISGNFTDQRKKGFMPKSELYLCPTCYQSKGLNHVDVEALTEAELLALYKKRGFVSPYEFTPSKRVHRLIFPYDDYVYIELDTEAKKVNMPFIDSGICSDKIVDRVYDYKDIIDFKVLENGSQIMEGASLVKAAIGGLVFGGAGAVVGALHGGRAITTKCSDLAIKVIINDINNPDVYITFIGSNSGGFTKPQETDGSDYKELVQALEKCISILTLILRENHESQEAAIMSAQSVHRDSASTALVSTADILKELLALKDQGLITEEEYTAKRTEIINGIGIK